MDQCTGLELESVGKWTLFDFPDLSEVLEFSLNASRSPFGRSFSNSDSSDVSTLMDASLVGNSNLADRRPCFGGRAAMLSSQAPALVGRAERLHAID